MKETNAASALHRVSKSLPVTADEARARRIRPRLLAWWRKSGRHFWWRRQGDPFTTTLVEILLRQTRATASADYIKRFVENYPSPRSLARSSVARLAADLKPLGFHRQRARQLKALGRHLDERGEPLSPDRDKLLALPGIGPYASSAIRCFAFGLPEPTIDVNVARIFQRVFGIAIEKGEPRRNRDVHRVATLTVTGGRSRELNWALIDLGSIVCTPRKPKCDICPLGEICAYAGTKRTAA